MNLTFNDILEKERKCCFQNASHSGLLKLENVWLEFKVTDINLLLNQSLVSTILELNVFEMIVGKGKNSGNQNCLLYPQYFQPLKRELFLPF